MKSVIVFAGTAEGRTLSEYLSGRQIPVTACTATEYDVCRRVYELDPSP